VKARCERCQAEVELAFAPAAAGIDVSCPACGATYFVPSAAPASPPPRPGEGEQECPKCGLIQPRADSCRRCGLVFVRWKGTTSAPSEPGADASEAERREAESLWAACESVWDDPSRHDAFLAFCQRTVQFRYAAGRYRAAQAGRGAAAEPAASRALERIEKLAITALELSSRRDRVVEPKLPYRNAVALLAIALLLVVGGLLWASFRQAKKGEGGEGEKLTPVLPVKKP